MRYGLVGTGFWAREAHAAAIAEEPGADLVGVWGRDPEKTSALAEHAGVEAFPDTATMFAEVDAVAFAVPPAVQAPLAVQAAGAGCHLLLEKPVALDLAAADEIMIAAEAGGVNSLVFLTSRFVPAVEEWLQQVIRRGGIHGARATWFGALDAPGNPFGQSPWRREYGALWDVGPHALSMVLPVLGPVVEVTATRGAGETVHLVLRHTTGTSSSLALSLTVPEAAATASFATYGDHGWDVMPTDHGTGAVAALREAVRELESMAGGGPTPACDMAFGREIVAVLAGAEQALQTHAPVAITPG